MALRVIPGRAEGANPESSYGDSPCGTGFRARSLRSRPGMTAHLNRTAGLPVARFRFDSARPLLYDADQIRLARPRAAGDKRRDGHGDGTDRSPAGFHGQDAGQAHHAALDHRQSPRAQRADADDPVGVLELPARHPSLHPRGRRHHHRGRGAPPRAGSQQSGAQARRDPHADLRHPGDQGRRDRARAPALAGGAALHHRRRGRLHRGQRRAHLHASGRFHRHPGLDLARPRQGIRRRDDLARRPRRAAGQSSRRDLLRRLRGRRRVPAVAAAARLALALRLRHAAARAGHGTAIRRCLRIPTSAPARRWRICARPTTGTSATA